MKSFPKNLLIAGLIATFGFAASAQTPQGPGSGGPGQGHGQMMGRGGPGQGDPAAMQARMTERFNQRMEKFKTVLQIKPEQQGAWTAFTAAMQPSSAMMAARQQMHADMATLTTPQRIDKMQAMRTQRAAEMDKKATAVKTFYAALTPEQQKAFDAISQKRGGMGGGRGGMGHHGHEGGGMGQGMGGYGMGRG